MRAITPNIELPDNVQAVLFRAPAEREDVQDIAGLVHKDEDGQPVAIEFMFELSKQDLHVLKHEPFLTLILEGSELAPFSLQATIPYDEKYKTLSEHSHVCTENVTHEKQQWWRCDNPSHTGEVNNNTIRMCTSCFDTLTSQVESDSDELEDEIEDLTSDEEE